MSDGIDTAVGFTSLAKVRLGFHQTGLLQPFEGGVDLGRLHIPGRLADNRRERGVQFIAVTGFLCKQP
jgi:hypothetical protein